VVRCARGGERRVLLHDRLQRDQEEDQAGGDLQHQHGNGEVVEHALAEARRDADGAGREQEGARGETEAKDVVAILGGGNEGAKQLDRAQHEEEQGKDHAPGDGTFGSEHAGGLRGRRDRQERCGDSGRELLHGGRHNEM
jgi:hypothetical protein